MLNQNEETRKYNVQKKKNPFQDLKVESSQ